MKDVTTRNRVVDIWISAFIESVVYEAKMTLKHQCEEIKGGEVVLYQILESVSTFWQDKIESET